MYIFSWYSYYFFYYYYSRPTMRHIPSCMQHRANFINASRKNRLEIHVPEVADICRTWMTHVRVVRAGTAPAGPCRTCSVRESPLSRQVGRRVSACSGPSRRRRLNCARPLWEDIRRKSPETFQHAIQLPVHRHNRDGQIKKYDMMTRWGEYEKRCEMEVIYCALKVEQINDYYS